MVIRSAATTTIVLFFATIAFGETLSPDDRERAAAVWRTIDSSETNGGITMSKVRDLKDEERDILRQYFRERLENDRRFGLSGEGYLVKLAMLGDAEAREQIVAKWVRGHERSRTWDNPTDLVRLESPEVIAQIGEMLFMNEEDQMPWDVGYIAPQTSASWVIAETCGKSPAFSYDVQQWARRVNYANGRLDLVRVWYRENEALLKKGDFQAVQPGRLPVEVEAAQPVPADPVVNVEPVPSVPATPTAVATQELASTSSEWSFAAIAAGCLVLLGGLGLLLEAPSQLTALPLSCSGGKGSLLEFRSWQGNGSCLDKEMMARKARVGFTGWRNADKTERNSSSDPVPEVPDASKANQISRGYPPANALGRGIASPQDIFYEIEKRFAPAAVPVELENTSWIEEHTVHWDWEAGTPDVLTRHEAETLFLEENKFNGECNFLLVPRIAGDWARWMANSKIIFLNAWDFQKRAQEWPASDPGGWDGESSLDATSGSMQRTAAHEFGHLLSLATREWNTTNPDEGQWTRNGHDNWSAVNGYPYILENGKHSPALMIEGPNDPGRWMRHEDWESGKQKSARR